MKNTRIVLAILSFLFCSFNYPKFRVYVPKPGTIEYFQFIPGKYKVVSQQKDVFSEETIFDLKEEKDNFHLELKQKFERQSELPSQIKVVEVEVRETEHKDPTEKKFLVIYYGFDANNQRIWVFVKSEYVKVVPKPKKIEDPKKGEKNDEKEKKPKTPDPRQMLTLRRGFFIYDNSWKVFVPVAAQ